jgi:oligosaccharide repeat unit polymerase
MIYAKRNKGIVSSHTTVNAIENNIKLFFSNKWFIVVLLISTIYVLGKFAIFYQQVVLLNAIGDLRDSYYSGDMYGNEFELVQAFLLSPMDIICAVLWAYSLFRQRNWVFIVMTVFLFANNSLVGGRVGYLIIGFMLPLIMILLGIRIWKYLPALTGMLIVVYLIVSYITAARFGGSGELSFDNIVNNGVEETNKQIVTYSVGPVAAFNVSIDENFSRQIGGLKNGALFGASFVHLTYIIMNKLGKPFRQPFLDYSERIQDEYIDIGSGYWNALYTSVNAYYLDAGIIGVILYPFIFGSLFCFLIKLLLKTRSIWHLFLLGFMCRMVFFSICNYTFTSAFTLIMVFAFYCLGNRECHIK